ncbi:hypothetical protein ACE10X_13165 [Bradyrhizobium sp. Pha-3]|uniref:hypothetical protein n=1 Tax=Bradyrhizobium sp. Pha-3 TaxID=208375 RepID=UPI0035D4C823
MIPVSPQQPAAQPLPASPPQGNGPPPVTIDAVVQLLRNERMRGFRIDIETDSLVEADQAQEKQDATEFVTAMASFFKEFGPIVQQMPPLAPLASGMLQFAVRRHKVGQELEDLIEKTMGNVAQHLANPPPPQPSPDEQIKMQTAQIKGQAEAQKAQAAIQQTQIDGQAKQAAARVDLIGKVVDHQHAVAEHQLNAEAMARQAAADQHAHDLKMEQMENQAKLAKQKPKADK